MIDTRKYYEIESCDPAVGKWLYRPSLAPEPTRNYEQQPLDVWQAFCAYQNALGDGAILYRVVAVTQVTSKEVV